VLTRLAAPERPSWTLLQLALPALALAALALAILLPWRQSVRPPDVLPIAPTASAPVVTEPPAAPPRSETRSAHRVPRTAPRPPAAAGAGAGEPRMVRAASLPPDALAVETPVDAAGFPPARSIQPIVIPPLEIPPLMTPELQVRPLGTLDRIAIVPLSPPR
jgi:hypothetical protein